MLNKRRKLDHGAPRSDEDVPVQSYFLDHISDEVLLNVLSFLPVESLLACLRCDISVYIPYFDF